MDIKERTKLRVSGADLRPMATEIVTKEIAKGTNMKVFNILRGAGRKVKVLQDRDAAKKQQLRVQIEDLRKWFGKGKKGDWVRVGTDGEIKGDCARDEGEGKPKCMPRDKAHSMSKKDRGASARRKRRADPDVDRPGTGNKPIMVKTDKKKNESVDLEEKNVPTNPKLWAKFKSQAKAKFDVYPSAYANGWASKQYKAAGGGWKSVKESIEEYKKENPMVMNLKGKKVELLKTGSSFKPTFTLTVDGKEKGKFGSEKDAMKHFARMTKESVELDENKLKAGDKVKTPQGTVEIKARDTSAMRGKQDKFTMILHMKNGKKASMGSHPSPSADAVKNIAKRFDKGVPSYMAHLNKESVNIEEKAVSKSQQKFFAMVRAKQKGKMKDASPEVKKAADSMSKKDVKDFASTKHKGLPDKKESSIKRFTDECWDTHKQVGTKMKGGKVVPNCVPK